MKVSGTGQTRLMMRWKSPLDLRVRARGTGVTRSQGECVREAMSVYASIELTDPPRPLLAASAAAPSEFVTGLVLTTPRMMQMNVQNIYDDVMDNTIDLEPDYQRGVVWTKPKQSAVIESLLSHYYVPPILLSEKREGGQVKYTCIDGKQRMSSIKLFMNNEVSTTTTLS